jgi:predicted phosphodiesterase
MRNKNKEFDDDDEAMLVSTWIDLPSIDKLKKFAKKAKSNYKILIGDIVKTHTDDYLAKQVKSNRKSVSK